MALQDDINEQITEIKTNVAGVANQPVNFGLVKTALLATADAIDAVGGNTVAMRTAIGNIPTTQTVSLGSSKAALDGMVSLLIDGSNFDGIEQ